MIVLMRPTVLRTPELAALQVAEEKKRLPGVAAAEVENERMEKSYWDRSKKEFKQKTPFTPEEVQLYGNPPPPTSSQPPTQPPTEP